MESHPWKLTTAGVQLIPFHRTVLRAVLNALSYTANAGQLARRYSHHTIRRTSKHHFRLKVGGSENWNNQALGQSWSADSQKLGGQGTRRRGQATSENRNLLFQAPGKSVMVAIPKQNRIFQS
jgi:hypothetical protein